jgi:hypothetical protein
MACFTTMTNKDLSPETMELLSATAFLFGVLVQSGTLQEHITPEASQFRRMQETFEFAKIANTFDENVALEYIRCFREMYESYHPELFEV